MPKNSRNGRLNESTTLSFGMNEINLIKRTLDGKKEAFGQLVMQYQKPIYRFIYQIIGNATEAQDIAQEVFIKAYQSLDTLKDQNSFRAWLMKIARNSCYNWIRQKQDNLFSLDSEMIEYNLMQFPPAPDEMIIKEELYARVMSAIAELPEKDRTVIEMFYLEEKSYQEIQQELGISKSLLGWRLSNARAKLRQKLQAAYHGIAFWRHFQWRRIAELANVKISSMSAVKFFLVSIAIHLTVVMTAPKVHHGKGYNQGHGDSHGIGFVDTALLPSVTQEFDQLDSYSASPGRAGQSDLRVWATKPDIIATSIGPIEQPLPKSTGISSQQPNNASRLRLLVQPRLLRDVPPEPSLPVDNVLVQLQSCGNAVPTFEQVEICFQRGITDIPSGINRPDSSYPLISVNDSVSMIAAPSEDTTSPKIVFVSDRERRYRPRIYIMNIDGSEAVPITNFTDGVSIHTVHPGGLSVSPTGEQIAFHARFPGKNWNIYFMNADGKNVTQLTADYIKKTALFPAWSPDGAKIAFCHREGQKTEIYVMRADGSNPVNLTKNQSVNFHPAWSPDGTKIAFSSNMKKDRRIRNIYVMDADGKNLKQLTKNRKLGWKSGHPAWSPDGKQIAYDSGKSDRRGGFQSTIFIMDAGGKNPRPLITRASRPSWSPDGQKIVFVSNRDGNDEIYMIDVFASLTDAFGLRDGKNLKRLTKNRYLDTDPCWLVPGYDF